MDKESVNFKERLAQENEITLSVTGRKSGRKISVPVWFSADEQSLYLLPAQGSDTQWYKNVLSKPVIWINAGGTETELNVQPVTDAATVSSVINKFRERYGVKNVATYYSKFDVAVVAPIG